jgi:hypothetical protein
MVNAFRFPSGERVQVPLRLPKPCTLHETGSTPPTAIYIDTGNKPKREGHRNSAIAPGGACKTQDGYLNIVFMNEDQWKHFCVALDQARLRELGYGDEITRLAEAGPLKL